METLHRSLLPFAKLAKISPTSIIIRRTHASWRRVCHGSSRHQAEGVRGCGPEEIEDEQELEGYTMDEDLFQMAQKEQLEIRELCRQPNELRNWFEQRAGGAGQLYCHGPKSHRTLSEPRVTSGDCLGYQQHATKASRDSRGSCQVLAEFFKGHPVVWLQWQCSTLWNASRALQ